MNDQSAEGRGRFIVIEGIDGAGTTTQARLLVDRLREQGHEADLDREPTDERIGRLLREILRGEYQPGGEDRGSGRLEKIIALLFAADRLDHVGSIEDRLAKGRFVVSDRYLPSSLAYQSVFCELAWVKALNKYAITPDLTFFLQVAPEDALARVGAREGLKERYEKLDTLKRVDHAYRYWAKESTPKILNGMNGIEAIAAEIQAEVLASLGDSVRPTKGSTDA